MTEKYGGELPRDHAALRSLPGIGDYTAGAIASIAFGLSAPKIALAVFSMALVIWRHKGNIQRLLAGTEPDFKAHKKDKTE